jgi:hypothetical protein
MFNLHSAIACAVCFGDPESPLTKGVIFGMLTLFAIVSCVLFCLGRFFWRFAKRSRQREQIPSST